MIAMLAAGVEPVPVWPQAQPRRWGGPRPGAGRPRVYSSNAERQAAYRARQRAAAQAVCEDEDAEMAPTREDVALPDKGSERIGVQLRAEVAVYLSDPLHAFTGRKPVTVTRELAQLATALAGGSPAAAESVALALWARAFPQPSWWRTPLGLAVARVLPVDPDASVSAEQAAAVLDMRTRWVTTLATQGRLQAGPDGGVTWGSVLDLLVLAHDAGRTGRGDFRWPKDVTIPTRAAATPAPAPGGTARSVGAQARMTLRQRAVVRWEALGSAPGAAARELLAEEAGRVAARLQPGPRAAERAEGLVRLLFGPALPPNEWWRTPLGMVVAAVVVIPRRETVTLRDAAVILGVSYQRVSQLSSSGQLRRGRGRGVGLDSVLTRLVDRAGVR